MTTNADHARPPAPRRGTSEAGALLGRCVLTFMLLAPASGAAAEAFGTVPLGIGGPTPPAQTATDPDHASPPTPVPVELSTSDRRLTLDLSSRVIFDTEQGETATENFIGFDLHQVFSDAHGDRATLTLQGFLTRIDNQPRRPDAFEDDDEWEFIYRIFNANFTLANRGRLNLRIGHFEVPFGLEQNVNTNGTLRNFRQPRNVGLLTDWGASLNGTVDGLDYEVSLTRGSGIEYLDRDDPWLVTGRVGRELSENLSVGLSGLTGEALPLRNGNRTVRRVRAGIDATCLLGPFTLMGQVTVGEDDDRSLVNTFAELNWQDRHGRFLLYAQALDYHAEAGTGGMQHSASVIFGVRWMLDAHWTLSAEIERDTDRFDTEAPTRLLRTQLRYRF